MKLHYETVSPLLRKILTELMSEDLFNDFRLVGGTSLSLQIGHRISTDIDLFTDVEYGSLDFDEINMFLKQKYAYVDSNDVPVGMGKAYFIGDSEESCIKLDLYYTDNFIEPEILIDGIRLATINEIVAMKMDVIQRVGRKKDFWDIYELLNSYTFIEFLELHKRRYPYTHEKEILRSNFTNFVNADHDFEPICLKNKVWELVKLDLIEFLEK